MLAKWLFFIKILFINLIICIKDFDAMMQRLKKSSTLQQSLLIFWQPVSLGSTFWGISVDFHRFSLHKIPSLNACFTLHDEIHRPGNTWWQGGLNGYPKVSLGKGHIRRKSGRMDFYLEVGFVPSRERLSSFLLMLQSHPIPNQPPWLDAV